MNARTVKEETPLTKARPSAAWRWYAIVGGLTFAAYLPSLRAELVNWDDVHTLVANPAYRGLAPGNVRWMFSTFHMGHYQPLSWMTFGLDFVVWGMKPGGYHLTSVLLHALAAVLFARLATRLFEEHEARSRNAATAAREPPGAKALFLGVFVALAWSLHPLRVEAVTWVTERREVLCGVLTLLALASHVGNRRRWITAAIAALAMLAKATAMLIPILIVLIDVWRQGGIGAPGWWKAAARSAARHALLFVLAVATALVAIAAQRESEALVDWNTLPLTSRLALYSFGISFYSSRTLVPFGLAPIHQGQVGSTWQLLPFIWWQGALGLAVAAVSIVLGWRFRHRSPAWLCLVAAFLAMVVPIGGFGQSGRQVVGERYAYQPGWVLALAIGVAAAQILRTTTRRSAWMAVAVVVLAASAAASVRQQRFWSDSESLWKRELSVYPDNPHANHLLGLDYARRAPPDFAAAEPLLRRAITAAPDDAAPRADLADLLSKTNRIEQAIEIYLALVLMKPGDVGAWRSLADVAWTAGRKAEAIEALSKVQALDPKNPEAYRQHARARAAAGDPRAAIAIFERGMTAAPHPALASDFAWLLATHPDPSVRDGARALSLAEPVFAALPDDPRTLVMFAAACAEKGDFERARREVEHAITKVPKDREPALAKLVEDLRARRPIRTPPRFP